MSNLLPAAHPPLDQYEEGQYVYFTGTGNHKDKFYIFIPQSSKQYILLDPFTLETATIGTLRGHKQIRPASPEEIQTIEETPATDAYNIHDLVILRSDESGSLTVYEVTGHNSLTGIITLSNYVTREKYKNGEDAVEIRHALELRMITSKEESAARSKKDAYEKVAQGNAQTQPCEIGKRADLPDARLPEAKTDPAPDLGATLTDMKRILSEFTAANTPGAEIYPAEVDGFINRMEAALEKVRASTRKPGGNGQDHTSISSSP